MSSFSLDIQGQLNSIKLADSKSLWPLFEAVVNAIQSIEDSPNRDSGNISIVAYREEQPLTLDGIEQLGKFESFEVVDNGTGFNAENYKSFNTAYSTFKITKGCKGIGRFLWLKAFNSVNICSVFHEDGAIYKREFDFNPVDGVTPENNVINIDSGEPKTAIFLKGFSHLYRQKCPVELDVIAKKVIEHCLLFFISDNCPQITISDNVSATIDLNQYFNANIKDSLNQDKFELSKEEFVLYHLRLPEGSTKHELHLCANMQEVASIELKHYMPDLQKKIVPADFPTGFYYVGYLTSPYLDSIVNTTRTEFNYDEKFDQVSLQGTGKDSLISSSIGFIAAYLADYIIDIKDKKRKEIDRFVANDRPAYRYLLGQRPEVYERIPAGLSPDKLELELHKEVQAWERDIKTQGQELEKAARNLSDFSSTTYADLFEKYWSGITEISKTSLAEYVTRRKTLLAILEDTLTIQENGKFKKEDAIHSIICPMRHTSNDVEFKEMNLWIIDERLAYHQFLASDKTIKSFPDVDSKSTKELDIAIFDRSFAFSDDDAPLNTITIIEFKKPDNIKGNPLSQMGKYIDEIVSGSKRRANGLSFGASSSTSFRCFAICDMSPKMEAHCKDACLRLMPDGMGYYGYQPERNAYFEVISYPKLLADAKKRNRILFEKLFDPNPNEIIHFPNT